MILVRNSASRPVIRGIVVALVVWCSGSLSLAAEQPTPPSFVQRAQPGRGQAALQPLVGKWKVEKALFVAVGTPDKPAKSDNMTTERVWIADGRFLQDVTRGEIGGQKYFRTGFLGYNNMDRCFEWVTADAFTPIMMIYRGKTGAGPAFPASLDGSFTDLGVTGEQNVGKRVPMRIVIHIENNDRHVFEIYFTPPDGKEVLADRMVYTRLRN
jgi:hypothetical protein